jgi:tetratricopeptide (TPR) repeat protein
MANRLLLISFVLAALSVANPSQAAPAHAAKPVALVDEEYDRYRKQGDEFFAKGEYERAKGRYENCLEVPGFAQDEYAKKRIELINRLLTLRKQAADALDEARQATGPAQQSKGKEAMELYQQILSVNPNDAVTKGFMTEYWSEEGNKFYSQKKYAEAKASYEEALKYAARKDLLQIQVQNSERFLQLETKPDVASQSGPPLPTSSTVSPPGETKKVEEPAIRPYSYKPLTGLKIAVGAVGVGAAVMAVLTRSQIQGKLDDLNALSKTADPDGDDVILDPTQYEQWKRAYDDAKSAKSKENMVTVYAGVAVAAVVAETVLLLRKPKPSAKGFSWQTAPTGVGLSLSYRF